MQTRQACGPAARFRRLSRLDPLPLAPIWGDPSVFLTRPIAASLLAVAAVILLAPALLRLLRRVR